MAIDPAAIGGYFTNFWVGASSSLMRWVGYFFTSFIILTVFILIYFALQYKYRVELYKIEGNSISKPKWERARITKNKGVIKWRLFMSRKNIKPVEYEYIYQRNKVYLLRTGTETFVPLKKNQRFSMDDGKTTLHNMITPVDQDVSYWYQLQQQQIARDYMPEDAARKQMIIVVTTILFCLILCGFTVWLVFKNVQPIVGALKDATSTPLMQSIVEKVAPN